MNGIEATPVAPLPWWRRVLPFVVGAALLAWVLRDVSLDELGARLSGVDVPSYLAVVVALAIAGLVVDVATAAPTYRRMGIAVELGDLLAVRAAAFLPGLVNYHVGQAWLAWVLVRRGGADAYRAAAATFVINAVALVALLLATTLALGRSPHADGLAVLVGVGIAITAAYAAILVVAPGGLVRRAVLAPLFELGLAGHLRALLVRLPSVVVSFAIVWLPLRWFGIDIPVADALRVVPPVVVLAALPITPAGLGTRDAVAAALLVGFTAGTPEQQRAAVVACTFTTSTIMTIAQVVMSLVFAPRARRLQR